MVYQPQRQYQPMMPKYPLLAWPKDFKMLHFPLYIYYGPQEKEIWEVLKGSSVGWMARLFGIGPLLASCLALDIYLKPLIIDFKCIPLLCVSCNTLSLSLTTLFNVNSNFSPIDIKVRCLHSSLKKGFCWNVRPLLRTEEYQVVDRLTFIYWYE